MTDLTHLNERGEAHMVDIGAKPPTAREASAEGSIAMSADALDALCRGDLAKGDALGAARIAGIMAAKRTAEVIPLCHPIALTHLDVVLTPQPQAGCVHCQASAATQAATGVEMEALNAVQAALLTVYDMCKALDRGMRIDGVRLIHKRGGRSGEWRA